MKITICDDSIEDLLHTDRLLEKYKKLNPFDDFDVEKYSDSAKLSFDIDKEKNFSDIFILDMLMPLQSGIDLAKLIRQKKEECTIIFTTSSEDYALQAFGVRAIRYLVKPLDEISFFEAINYALSFRNIKKESLYPVKTKEGIQTISCFDIEYVENSSRIIQVYLNHGGIVKSVFIRKTFEEEAIDLIQNKNFIQVHKSFIVNMQYINKLLQDEIIMENGNHIPVSKKKSSEVKRIYLSYMTERYR